MRDTVDGECPICLGLAKKAAWTTADYEEFACEQCGTFRMSGSAIATAGGKTEKQKRAALAVAVRRQKIVNTIPMVEGLDFL